MERKANYIRKYGANADLVLRLLATNAANAKWKAHFRKKNIRQVSTVPATVDDKENGHGVGSCAC